MTVLYWLESVRVPALDKAMSLITHLGEETVFLVLALAVFWCVDKRRGYYLLTVGFAGTIFNQFLKLACRVPRPWVIDPEFTIVESARAEATGYSFPSGHTQNAVGTFGVLAVTAQRKWMRWLCLAVMVAVPFSRMYLGVHTPWDVGISTVVALGLIAVLHPVFYGKGRGVKRDHFILFAMALLAGAFVAFVEFWPFPADIDPANYRSGVKNAYTLLGAVLGVNLACYVDERWLHFEVKAGTAAQIIKLTVGLTLAMAVKAGLKEPLYAVFNGHFFADAMRYFLLVVTAGCLWPACFRFLQPIDRKKHL